MLLPADVIDMDKDDDSMLVRSIGSSENTPLLGSPKPLKPLPLSGVPGVCVCGGGGGEMRERKRVRER